jgi:hypothetical protein
MDVFAVARVPPVMIVPKMIIPTMANVKAQSLIISVANFAPRVDTCAREKLEELVHRRIKCLALFFITTIHI